MTYVIYIKRCQSSSYEWMFQNTDDLFFYRPTTILDLSKLFWRWPNILDMVQNVNFSSKKLFLSGSKHFVLIEGKGISNAFKNFDNYFTPLCVHSKIRGYEMYTCANTSAFARTLYCAAQSSKWHQDVWANLIWLDMW